MEQYKGYQASIFTKLTLLKRTDIPPAVVEGWMRLQYGTLGHLDPVTFHKETLLAIDCHDANPAESIELAKSFGLIN